MEAASGQGGDQKRPRLAEEQPPRQDLSDGAESSEATLRARGSSDPVPAFAEQEELESFTSPMVVLIHSNDVLLSKC